jgi:hypothetical protein
MFFHTKDASFTCSFEFDAKISAPTEIYIYFDLHYPDGYVAKADIDGFRFERVGQTNYMTLEHDDPKSVNGKIVTIAITRKVDLSIAGLEVKESDNKHINVEVSGKKDTVLKLIGRDQEPIRTISLTEDPITVSVSPADLQAAEAVLYTSAFYFFESEVSRISLQHLNFGHQVTINAGEALSQPQEEL